VSVGDWTYLGLGVSPIGGLLASIPWGMFEMHYPAWLVIASSPPMAYVQVIVIDALWSSFQRSSYFRRLIEGKRSPRVEKLLASRGSFWATLLATPLVGPWVVMAFMRYAQVPQRKVALPMLLSLLVVSAFFTAMCVYVPSFFAHKAG
jgi:hypothetical protein